MILANRVLAVLPFILAGSMFTNRAPVSAQVNGIEPRPGEVFSARELRLIQSMSPLPPVSPDETNVVADDPRAARLGQFLFFDPRMSTNGLVACSTCHDPKQSFSDGKAIGAGVGMGERHTATLWNVAYQRWFFWDGRADTLWSQALRPIESPTELGASRLHLAHLISRDRELARAYEAVFGPLPPLAERHRFPESGRPVPNEPSHPDQRAWDSMRSEDQEAATRILVNVAKSIAAYERRLISHHSPFDQFAEALRVGDATGVERYSEEARRGLRLFLGRGQCRLCHSGPNFTDGEFHDTRLRTTDGGPPRDSGRFGGADLLLRDPFNARGAYSDARTGRAVEKIEHLANGPQNWGLFKTPTLRNVARTAPYMHRGQLKTLRDVVLHYSALPDGPPSHHPERILVRLNLTESEVDDLVAFLESLTDVDLDPSLLCQPPTPTLDPPPG